MPQLYCEKCHKSMSDTNFYVSKNQEKYPTGKLSICKKCITMHVDNWDPSTYLWIIQEADVPYVPEEWNTLLRSYAKDRAKVSGMTVLGRYLSKMNLNQYKDYRWKDSDFLQQLADKRTKEAMERAGYDIQEITEVIEKGRMKMPKEELPIPEYNNDSETEESEDYFNIINGPPSGEDESIDLTDEDRTYLRLKWGKSYKPEEWVRLEQLYREMMESYDIQAAGHIDILKLACKASLKANQLLDIADIEGAQKAVKMYDSLMKGGRFTAAQIKEETGDAVDSIGEIVAMCEKDGFIPKYYVDGPQDKVDRVLQDMQQYTHDLITEEVSLGPLIERAIQSIEEEKEKLKNNTEEVNEEQAESDLFDYEKENEILKDIDFNEFSDLEDELEAIDDNTLLEMMERE